MAFVFHLPDHQLASFTALLEDRVWNSVADMANGNSRIMPRIRHIIKDFIVKFTIEGRIGDNVRTLLIQGLYFDA